MSRKDRRREILSDDPFCCTTLNSIFLLALAATQFNSRARETDAEQRHRCGFGDGGRGSRSDRNLSEREALPIAARRRAAQDKPRDDVVAGRADADEGDGRIAKRNAERAERDVAVECREVERARPGGVALRAQGDLRYAACEIYLKRIIA